jgi:hypothetical protein
MPTSSQSPSPTWPWAWPADTMPNPFSAFASWLNQSINPGWTFGNVISVTEENSSAPDTERQVVAKQSYGRQLNRVIEALAVLIEERPEGSPDVEALDKFMKLRQEVGAIKLQAAERRVKRISADLATLKQTNPDEFQRVATALRKALGDGY